MNDLIPRQAAIDAINCDITVTGRQNAELVAATIGTFVDRIKALPSAQPERIKGKWTPHREKSREYIGATLIYVTYDYWSCDTCGYRVEDGQPLYNFCPHCGADMRGERNELSEREIEQCCDNCKWYRSMDDYCVSCSCNIDGREKHSCFEEK